MSWQAVRTPQVQLRRVAREKHTQGTIHMVWLDDSEVYLSQSLPALVAWLNRTHGTQLLASSLYRVAGGQQSQHLGWHVARFKRKDLYRLNWCMSTFEQLVFYVKDPNCWVLTAESGRHLPPVSSQDPEPEGESEQAAALSEPLSPDQPDAVPDGM